MTTSEPARHDAAGPTTRRRSGRLNLVVPLEVQWQQARQGVLAEPARTRDMSPHGALLLMKRCPPLHASVILKNLLSGEAAAGRVTHLRRSAEGKLIGAAVELLEPSEKFWGLTFQLQNAAAQLLTIENSFQAARASVDFRVLQGLREAVEDLRRIASAVQQWQELQVDGKDAYTVLELITRARVERAVYLLNEINADVDSGAITSDSEEFGHFTRAVERLYERITQGPLSFRHAE
jgi:hypothetical protein